MAKDTSEKTHKDFPGQHADEDVVLVFRQHPVVMRHQLIYGMLAILLGVVPMMLAPLANWPFQFLGIVFVCVLIYWFHAWIGWYYSVYIVTTQRLIDIRQKGFFNRKVSEVGFEKVQSINYHIKGLQAALLKFGDITVQTYTGNWVLANVYHPEEVHSEMMQVAHKVTSTPPVN